MIKRLDKNLDHKALNKSTSLHYIDTLVDTSFDFKFLLDSEFVKYNDLNDYYKAFKKIVLLSESFIRMGDSSFYSRYYFRQFLTDLFKVYLNSDIMEFVSVEYNVKFNNLLPLYYIMDTEASHCKHLNKNGFIAIDRKCFVYMNINKESHSCFGCYIVTLKNKITEQLERYVICYKYKNSMDYYKVINIPYIRKISEDTYNSIKSKCNDSEMDDVYSIYFIDDYIQQLKGV